ncbi:MAG: TonB family protein, partial [Gemmatimonadota bacterium]
DSLDLVAREDSIVAARIAAAAVASAVITADGTSPSEAVEDLETLRALGPSYIPYDDGPKTIWTTETQATLSKTLLPVLREESLPATTRSIFWVLISREGHPEEIQIQTSSGNETFDRAAESFLEQLRFIPAIRTNRAVASWVLREISILMQ